MLRFLSSPTCVCSYLAETLKSFVSMPLMTWRYWDTPLMMLPVKRLTSVPSRWDCLILEGL